MHRGQAITQQKIMKVLSQLILPILNTSKNGRDSTHQSASFFTDMLNTRSIILFII